MDKESKNRWWVVGVAVPIVVGIIAIVPGPVNPGTPGSPVKVTVSSINLIIEQAENKGIVLTDDVKEKLVQAIGLMESQKFQQALVLLEESAESAPLPAVLHNVRVAADASSSRAGGQAAAGSHDGELPTPPLPTWTGNWEWSDSSRGQAWTVVTITQSGTAIKATFSWEGGDGWWEGIVIGNRLEVTFGNTLLRSGKLKLVMETSGQSFTGTISSLDGSVLQAGVSARRVK